MEKTNKVWITITVILIVLAIILLTAYKVIKDHNDKVLLVESKYIIEKAKDCVNQKKCNKDTITLKELYELGFLKRQVNEVTKEYYNESSYVKIKDSNYEFIIVN